MMKKMKKYENNMVDEIQPTINLLRIQCTIQMSGVRSKNLLFLNQNICCGYSKEHSQ